MPNLRRIILCTLAMCVIFFVFDTPRPVAAWIMDSQVVDYSPNRKSYIAYISQWYMNSNTMTDGLIVYQVTPDIYGSWSQFYAGDKLETDYAGGIPYTQSYNANTKQLTIKGQGTILQYNRILMAVYFITTNTAQAWRVFNWNLGANILFWRWSHRWYWWRPVSNPAIVTWDTAVADCQSLTYFGMQGYLATGEHYWASWFIFYYARGQRSWLGASDNSQPNSFWWRWVQGPMLTFFQGGQGLPFYGQVCVTQPVGAYYPPWFFPAWYRNMFPNTGSIPPSWATFLKACLKRFGSPIWCPNTPIQAMTTCTTNCISGAFCRFAAGFPTSQPPSAPVTSPYASPSWQASLPPNAKDVLPASWTLPKYKNTGRHRLMMQTNFRWTDQASSDPVG